MSTDTMTNPWMTKAGSGEGGSFEKPPVGSTAATCVAIVDMGTHRETYNGKTKTQRQIMLAWELAGEKKENGEPFVVGESYTWSLNEKANLRLVVIEPWIGRTLSESEDFDIMSLMGRSCILNLSEGQTRTGKKFIGVASIAAPMRGMPTSKATLAPFAFHLSMIVKPTDDIGLPSWIPYHMGKPALDRIKESQEFQALAATAEMHEHF